jgi:hypothetical protein
MSKVHIQFGEAIELTADITVKAAWPTKVAAWLAAVTLGLLAVYALAATDLPPVKADTSHLHGRGY